jgi:hypothetical protein
MVRYAAPRKSRPRTGYARKAIVKRRPRTKATTKIVSIVKNTLARNVEQKMTVMPFLGSRASATTIVGQGLSANIPGNTLNIVPGIYKHDIFTALSLGQGTHQDQRIGNSVKTKSLSFRGVVLSLPTTTSNDDQLPFEVHLLWFKRKKFQSGTPVQAPDDLKQYATNTLIPVEPYLMNTVIPWNKDAYVIKAHRVFRLRPLRLGVVSASINGQNSNAPAYHRFHVNIPIKENLQFEDGATNPSNDWCSFAAYTVNQNGAAIFDGLGEWDTRAAISMDMVYRYTDA